VTIESDELSYKLYGVLGKLSSQSLVHESLINLALKNTLVLKYLPSNKEIIKLLGLPNDSLNFKNNDGRLSRVNMGPKFFYEKIINLVNINSEFELNKLYWVNIKKNNTGYLFTASKNISIDSLDKIYIKQKNDVYIPLTKALKEKYGLTISFKDFDPDSDSFVLMFNTYSVAVHLTFSENI
jgi:hypothetical protein